MKLILLLLSLSAFAAPKDYLFCLGKEEQFIHKHKIGGARKYLVEKIISETLLFGDYIALNKRYLDDVCQAKSPSLVILKMLLKKQNVFIAQASEYDSQAQSLAKSKIKSLREKSLHLFIGYLSWLKNQNQDVNCFRKYLPELSLFYQKILYTLEESGEQNLLSSLKNIDSIFKKLETYPLGQKKC